MTFAALVGGVWVLASTSVPYAPIVRDWAPGAYIPLGYWLSGGFFRGPMPRAEGWLQRWDATLFERGGLNWFADHGPRWMLEILELAYASVTPFVPLGFVTILLLVSVPDVDRFWAPVLAAEFACYGMLPWIQTRTPRFLQHHTGIDGRRLSFRRLNFRMLDRVSITVNTVPSGHAAGAIAVAVAVMMQAPVVGFVFLAVAISICLGAIVGRYHYAADVVAGAFIALAASLALGS